MMRLKQDWLKRTSSTRDISKVQKSVQKSDVFVWEELCEERFISLPEYLFDCARINDAFAVALHVMYVMSHS